jgi:hypothetical protein
MLKRATPRRSRRRAENGSDLRRRALAHETDGHVAAALRAWTALNRLQPDPEIEAHLVDLRCDPRHAESVVAEFRGEPAEQWPRRFDDPFPDLSGRVPEIPVDQLTVEVLGGAILHHGSLLVRGLIARDRIDELRATVDRAFSGREQFVQGRPSAETTPWYLPCAQWDANEPTGANVVRSHNDKCMAVHIADSPRALYQVIDALARTNVFDVVNEYLGEQALLSLRKTLLRRVTPDTKPAFHQDGTFMGLSSRAIDIWAALSECGDGTEAPGLSILPRRLDTSVRPDAAAPRFPLNAEELEAISGTTPVVTPKFEPGDAVLFDELCLHATAGDRPGLVRDRYAIEAWLFAPSTMPAKYLPIIV